MARLGINKLDVHKTTTRLMEEGKKPTVDAVRDLLGTGSKRRLMRHKPSPPKTLSITARASNKKEAMLTGKSPSLKQALASSRKENGVLNEIVPSLKKDNEAMRIEVDRLTNDNIAIEKNTRTHK